MICFKKATIPGRGASKSLERQIPAINMIPNLVKFVSMLLASVIVSAWGGKTDAANVYQFGSALSSEILFPGGSGASSGGEVDAIGGFLDVRYTFVSGVSSVVPVRADIGQVLLHDSSPLSILRSRLQFDGENSGGIDTPVPNGLG